jgi:hypothetical protein
MYMYVLAVTEVAGAPAIYYGPFERKTHADDFVQRFYPNPVEYEVHALEDPDTIAVQTRSVNNHRSI